MGCPVEYKWTDPVFAIAFLRRRGEEHQHPRITGMPVSRCSAGMIVPLVLVPVTARSARTAYMREVMFAVLCVSMLVPMRLRMRETSGGLPRHVHVALPTVLRFGRVRCRLRGRRITQFDQQMLKLVRSRRDSVSQRRNTVQQDGTNRRQAMGGT